MSSKRPAQQSCYSLGIVSLFPEMFDALHHGVVGRAIQENRLQLKQYNPRDYSQDSHQRVDDRPYGGGPGMVMNYQPVADAILAAKSTLPAARVIHLSPQGQPLTQQRVRELAAEPGLILLASRYEGVDQRLIDRHVDEEIAIGDFVVSGGELPAMMLIDAVARFLPGVLGDAESAEQDSFSHGLLDHPHYTRPEVIDGLAVPAVLLSGDHAAIAAWRQQQREKNTWQRRPDLLKRCSPDQSEYLSDQPGPTALPGNEENS